MSTKEDIEITLTQTSGVREDVQLLKDAARRISTESRPVVPLYARPKRSSGIPCRGGIISDCHCCSMEDPVIDVGLTSPRLLLLLVLRPNADKLFCFDQIECFKQDLMNKV